MGSCPLRRRGSCVSLRTRGQLYANTVGPRVDSTMESLRLRMLRQSTEDDGPLVSVGTLTDYPCERAGSMAWGVVPEHIRNQLGEDPTQWMQHPQVKQLPLHLQAIVDYSAQITMLEYRALAVRVPEWLAKFYPDVPPEIGNLWQRCSSIGTKLSAISKSEVIGLLIHGYVQAMGAATALIATERGCPGPLPISFPGFDRFEKLF